MTAGLVQVPGMPAGLEVWFAPGLTSVPPDVVAFVQDSGQNGIWLYDIAGVQIAAIRTSFYPTAVWRESTRELLVSDIPSPFSARLVSLDLDNRLALRWQAAIPDRSAYTLFIQPMLLSRDEHALYYSTFADSAMKGCELPEKPAAEACDVYGVGMLNLRDAKPSANEFVLPASCPSPNLQQGGLTGALVTCGASNLVFRAGLNPGTPEVVFSGQDLPANPVAFTSARSSASLVATFERADGSLAVLISNGELWVTNGDRVERRLRVTPAGTYPVLYSHFLRAGDEVAVPYQALGPDAREWGGGLTVVDIERLSLVRDLTFSAATSQTRRGFFVGEGLGDIRFAIDGTTTMVGSQPAGTVNDLAISYGDRWTLLR